MSLVVSMVAAYCQPASGGIESVRIGMNKETVGTYIQRPDVVKITNPRDRTQEAWTFRDSGGSNTITFENGKVVSVDAHTSSYTEEGRDLVKKLYSLLYFMTKGMPNDERTATATIVLREYPSVTGDEPLRHIELRFGDKHIDLTIVESDSTSSHVAFVGQGVGHPSTPRR